MTTPKAAIPSTVGQGPAAQNRNAAAPSQWTLIQSRNRGPVLRNPAFAGLSPRDPANRELARSTFGGRFAQSRFARDDDRDRRHHHFGRVIGFIGPIFWPYAYDDFIDYTFFPYAYDTFWPCAYDDVFEGIYGAYAPEAYAAGGTDYGNSSGSTRVRASRNGRSPRAAPTGGAAQICLGQSAGLTDFPIERIAQQVQLDQSQQALLDDLRASTSKALDVLKAACPSDLPSTPTGRLAAMRNRVETMLQAVRLVRPSLEMFYQSLSDEQKERFNALDAQYFGAAVAEGQQPDPAQVCGGGAAQATELPFARIERSLRLSDTQEAALKSLEDASAKAADILKANCPAAQPLTPTGRLVAMERRLDAMLQALDAVQPALAAFYSSLDDEQKAQFNRLDTRRQA